MVMSFGPSVSLRHSSGRAIWLVSQPRPSIDHGRHVGMTGIARERAAQHVHLSPRRRHAAAAAMGQRHDAVDVGKGAEQRLDLAAIMRLVAAEQFTVVTMPI